MAIFLTVVIICFIWSVHKLYNLCNIKLWKNTKEAVFTYSFFAIPLILLFILSVIGVQSYITAYICGSYLSFSLGWLIINTYENNPVFWKFLFGFILRIGIAIISVVIIIFTLFELLSRQERKTT